MHGVDLIETLTGSLVAALALGYLAQRLRLSPIVGYLLAGIAVGRHTPGFVADPAVADQLAEIGVVLLMFGVGLQLHLRDLAGVARVVVPGAVGQSAVSALLGTAVARAFGWAWPGAVVFGLSLSLASTAVAVRTLSDNRELHTTTGHVAVGWLVVEDLLAVVALVLLPGIVRPGATPATIAGSLAVTALKVAGLLALVLLTGDRAIRFLLDRVAESRSRELFTLAVLVLALGVAVGSAALFGVSMALGAFLAGLVVGRTDYGLRAASEALPMRDAFAVLFFVSIGMLLDPRSLLDRPALVAATLAVVVLGTPLVAGGLAVLRGVRPAAAIRVAAALAQIGEFSFILAALGRQMNLFGQDAVNTVVAGSIVSIVLNGPLYRLVVGVERRAAARGGWLAGRAMPRAARRGVAADSQASPGRRRGGDRAVIVGHGPTGRTLARLLRDNGLEPVVIEMNLETVRRLREDGVEAVYGDATYVETLAAAGVGTAAHLIISADLGNSREVIRSARRLNPKIQVLARTAHLRDVEGLRAAGANEVYSGEGEVALALTETVLHRLGATPEQMDRERERARRELLG